MASLDAADDLTATIQSTVPPLSAAAAAQCTPLERSVLQEYATLLTNLQRLAGQVSGLADHPTAEIMDGLRVLERKTSLVCTLLKASVYSIVLQQEIYNGDGDETHGGAGEGVHEM